MHSHFARADLYFPVDIERSRPHNQAFGDLIDYLDTTIPAGAPIFAFPALPMVYFISGHDNVYLDPLPRKADRTIRRDAPLRLRRRLKCVASQAPIRSGDRVPKHFRKTAVSASAPR